MNSGKFEFRAWDILGQRMLEWGSIFTLPAWEIFPGTPEQRPYDVMQYTGVKDIYGKKIYEGDIVMWKGIHHKEKYLVIWLGKYARFAFWKPGNVFVSGLVDGGNIVKLGDIYTTPEHWKEYGGIECWTKLNRENYENGEMEGAE